MITDSETRASLSPVNSLTGSGRIRAPAPGPGRLVREPSHGSPGRLTAAGTAAAVTDSDADSDLAAPSHHDVVNTDSPVDRRPRRPPGFASGPGGRGARAAAATIIIISRIMIVRDHDVDLDH